VPIGASLHDTPADALLLIGDRGMLPSNWRFRVRVGPGRRVVAVDGPAVVFACGCPAGVDLTGVARPWPPPATMASPRFEEIAREARLTIGVPQSDCLSYLATT